MQKRFYLRLYFGEGDVDGMFKVLDPLHARLGRGPDTLKETSFNQAYGRDLCEAQEWCQRYKVLILYEIFLNKLHHYVCSIRKIAEI